MFIFNGRFFNNITNVNKTTTAYLKFLSLLKYSFKFSDSVVYFTYPLLTSFPFKNFTVDVIFILIFILNNMNAKYIQSIQWQLCDLGLLKKKQIKLKKRWVKLNYNWILDIPVNFWLMGTLTGVDFTSVALPIGSRSLRSGTRSWYMKSLSFFAAVRARLILSEKSFTLTYSS